MRLTRGIWRAELRKKFTWLAIQVFAGLSCLVQPSMAQLPAGVPDAVPVAEWKFLQDEAIDVLEALGKPKNLTLAFARSEIRAHVFGRLMGIIAKDPPDRTPQESAAFAKLQAAIKQNRQSIANNAVTYWGSIADDDPCWGSPSPGSTVYAPPNTVVSLFCEAFVERGEKPNQREVYRGMGAAETYAELLTGNGRAQMLSILKAMDWFGAGAVHASGPLFESDTDAERRYQDVMNFFLAARDTQKHGFLLSLISPGSLAVTAASGNPVGLVIQALLVLGTAAWEAVDFTVIGNDLRAEQSVATPDLKSILDGQLLELTLVFMGQVLSLSQPSVPLPRVCGFNGAYTCESWNIRESDPDYTAERYAGIDIPAPQTDSYFAVKRQNDPAWQAGADLSPYGQSPHIGPNVGSEPGLRLWELPVPGSEQRNGELGNASTRLHDPWPLGTDNVSDLRVDSDVGLSTLVSDGFFVHAPVDARIVATANGHVAANVRDDDKWKYSTTLQYRNWLGEWWEAVFVDGTFLHLRNDGPELSGTAQVAGFVQHDGGLVFQDDTSTDGYAYCKAWVQDRQPAGEFLSFRNYSSVDGRCLLLSRDFDVGQVSVGDRIEIGGQVRTIEAKVNCEGEDLDNTGDFLDLFIEQLWCDDGDPGHTPDPATLNWGRTALLLDAPVTSLTGDGLQTGPSRRYAIRKLDETDTCPDRTAGLIGLGDNCAVKESNPRDFSVCPRFGERLNVDSSLLSNPWPEYIFDDSVWLGQFVPLDCFYSPMIRYQSADGGNWSALFLPQARALDDSYTLGGAQDELTIDRFSGVIANDHIPSSASITDKSGYRVSLVRDVEHGQLDLKEDGSFTYTRGQSTDDNSYNCGPARSPYCGPDSFEYEVCADRDGRTDCAIATAEIEVVNDAPRAYGVGFELINGGDGVQANYVYYDVEGDPEDGTVFTWALAQLAGGSEIPFTENTTDGTIPDLRAYFGSDLPIIVKTVHVTPMAGRGSWPRGPVAWGSRDAEYGIGVTCSSEFLLSDTAESVCVFSPWRLNLPFATDLEFQLKLGRVRNLGFNFEPDTCDFTQIDGFADRGAHTCTATMKRTAFPDSGERVLGTASIWLNGGFPDGDRVHTTGVSFPRSAPLLNISVTSDPSTGGTASCTPNPVPVGFDSTCNATASAGWHFAGWFGDDCQGGDAQCILHDVTSNRSVQANFYPVISTAVSPPGGGTVKCIPNPVPESGSKSASACTASASTGYAFGSWSGDCDGTSSLCRLSDITSPKSVRAHFVIVDPQGGISAGSTVFGADVSSDTGWIMTPQSGAAMPTIGWIPLTGSPNSPVVTPPDGVQLIYGIASPLLDFVLESGIPGSTATVTIRYPDLLPPGVEYWVYDRGQERWYALDPSLYTVDGDSITLRMTDGAEGDHDNSANGLIVAGPGGPAVTMAAGLPGGVALGKRTVALQVAAGSYHTCALLEQGGRRMVKCWGRNNFGQLGIGDTRDRGGDPNDMGNNLAEVNLGSDVKPLSIAAGREHTCALLKQGSRRIVKCWGRNSFGQVGLGDTNYRGGDPNDMGENLAAVNLGENVKPLSIAAGEFFTCALLKQGRRRMVKCWGRNDFGQLGLGDTRDRGGDPNDMGDNLPAVNLGNNVKPLGVFPGAAHSCALLKEGKEKLIKCWGDNSLAQLGLGIPAMGDDGACHIDPHNCRGDAPDEMGDNLPAVTLGENITSRRLTAGLVGDYHNCVALKHGRLRSLKCWGWNDLGQLGLGLPSSGDDDRCSLNPDNCRGDSPDELGDDLPFVNLGESVRVLSTTGGGKHMCALLKMQPGKEVKCWGSNDFGQLGLGDTDDRGSDPDDMGDNLPTVRLGSDVKPLSIAAGGEHTCALLKQSNRRMVKCWGRNDFGQLGIGDTRDRGGEVDDMGDNLPAVDLGTTVTD